METQININKKKIIIIGSGISGLAAAHELLKKSDFFDVKILEARPIYGGRISKNTEFVPDFPIETGAEEIHIKNSLYYDLVLRVGAKILPDTNLIHYIEDINGEKLVEREKFFEKYKLNEFYDKVVEQVENIDYNENVQDFFKKNGLNESFLEIYEPFWGAENGCELKQMSVKAQIEYDQGWQSDHDDNFLVQNMSHFDVLGKAFEKEIALIKYNKAVEHINYLKDDLVEIKTADQAIYVCNAVIITVPLSQLQNNSIQFMPEIPLEKKKAINLLKMGKGGKLHLKFQKRFWGENTGMIFLRSKIGFLWDCSFLRSDKSFVLCCLISGQIGEDMNDEKKRKILIKEMLQKLNNIYKVKTEEILEDYLWTEYSQIKYIEGTYSYASFAPTNIRNILAQNIENKVFFAGEATNNVYFATLNGAYDTGVREAKNIINLFLNNK